MLEFLREKTSVHCQKGAILIEVWGTENTYWKVEAPSNDLNSTILCHDIARVVPPTQG
jgi:hypothetical protein